MKLIQGAVAIFLVLVVFGCATMSQIITTPEKAEIYINKEKVGVSPVSVKLSNFVGNSYYLEAKKDGYQTFEAKLAKEAKIGNIIGGLFIWPLWLWGWGPEGTYLFELEQK